MTLILAIALTQLPVELHVCGNAESRLLLRAVNCDVPVVDEDTRAIRHYQDELRRIVEFRQSLDTFCRIGQHKFKLPKTAYDCPAMTVLCIHREIQIWNSPRRLYVVDDEYIPDVRFAGMVNLGDEGTEADVVPMPWEFGFRLTEWKAPEVHK